MRDATRHSIEVLSRRMGDEQGISLMMALLTMVVLSVAAISATQYTVSNQHHATNDQGGQVAYHLAESGVNIALSVLDQHYPTTWPGDPNLLPPTQIELDGGTVTYSGTLSVKDAIAEWVLTATSNVRNPFGEQPLSRTATLRVPVGIETTTSTVPPAWEWIYSGATGHPCDVTLQQSGAVVAPLYVAGNLCMQNTATIAQPSGATGNRLYVGGNLTMSQSANTVGATGNRLSEAHIRGSCKYKNNAATNPCQVNTANANVWVSSFFNTAPVPPVPVPTVAWWGTYQHASIGPFRPCTQISGAVPVFEQVAETSVATAVNLNADVPGVFNLTPPQSYSCKNALGTLAWDASSKVLTVSGTIFIDGSITISGTGSYTGQGTIYAYGTMLVKNSTLCAIAKADGSCDQANWDPNERLLIIACHGDGAAGGAQGQVPAGESVQFVSSNFQGGIYGEKAIEISTTSLVQGPLVSPSTVIPGQSGTLTFPPVSLIPNGAPGTPGIADAASLGTTYAFSS